MMRGLVRSLLVTLFAASALAPAGAARAPRATANSSVLDRFLATPDAPPHQYRALRHLEASNAHFNSTAWMDVWTEADRSSGFRYSVVTEGGSAYIRSRVFLATLEAERSLWASALPQRGALTRENYVFENPVQDGNGLARLTVRPRRKDMLLVEGSIFLNAENADLVRVEGRLSKSPSIWTRRVEIVRSYERIGGVRMPVAVDSVATLFIAGRATFQMTYAYETVNGQRVGSPQPTLASREGR